MQRMRCGYYSSTAERFRRSEIQDRKQRAMSRVRIVAAGSPASQLARHTPLPRRINTARLIVRPRHPLPVNASELRLGNGGGGFRTAAHADGIRSGAHAVVPDVPAFEVVAVPAGKVSAHGGRLDESPKPGNRFSLWPWTSRNSSAISPSTPARSAPTSGLKSCWPATSTRRARTGDWCWMAGSTACGSGPP